MKEVILAKLKEGSTWGGIGVLVTSLTFIPHASELGTLMPAIGTVVAGILAIYFKD